MVVGDEQRWAATGGGVEEARYSTAKTSIWWDMENCPVPEECYSYLMARNISSALDKMNYRGPVSIRAYGDASRISNSVQQALSRTGIEVRDANGKRLLSDLLLWALDNRAPANILLISCDPDFSNALHQLRLRRYNILLAKPRQGSDGLVAAANCVWLWTTLVRGGFPFSVSGENSNINAHHQEMMQNSHQDVVQGLVDVILLALKILRDEMIRPTEGNITECIRYGDPANRDIDVRKALDCALEQEKIVERHILTTVFYVGRNEGLWTCKDGMDGEVKHYPKATWNAIHKFLSSVSGRSNIKASECRYEAALILKKSCLKEYSLGEVLVILDIMITKKKWIKHARSGWQPIIVTVFGR